MTSCSQCGECCRYWVIGSLKSCNHDKRLLEYLRARADKFDRGYFLAYAPCHHLGDDNKCRIYEERPQLCRAYTGQKLMGKKAFYQPGCCTQVKR